MILPYSAVTPGRAFISDEMRDWLTANVGVQGTDWDTAYYGHIESPMVFFKNEENLIMFLLIWGR